MRPEDANSSALAFRAIATLTTLQRDLVAWQAEDTRRKKSNCSRAGYFELVSKLIYNDLYIFRACNFDPKKS